MIDMAKSHIPSQWSSAGKSWQNMAEHCYEINYDQVWTLQKKKKMVYFFFHLKPSCNFENEIWYEMIEN